MFGSDYGKRTFCAVGDNDSCRIPAAVRMCSGRRADAGSDDECPLHQQCIDVLGAVRRVNRILRSIPWQRSHVSCGHYGL